MARIRSLKPEAPQHRKVGRLSIWARWLWVVMITQADDEGRLPADPGQLRLLAFGYDEDITTAKVSALLDEIAATGLIVIYPVAGVPYAYFPSWADHQRINRPTPSKLPPPPSQPSSVSPQGAVTDLSVSPQGGLTGDRRDRRKEGKEGSARGTIAAPTVPPVARPPYQEIKL